nr:flagellar hook-length control protein FliK [Dechloromonas sp. A34]
MQPDRRPGQRTSAAGRRRHLAPPGIAAHLNENAWPKQFGDKVVWMAKNDQQSAQININPPQLGPIQITLNLSGDQATLAFASPHAEVRQAIESALPQLKEMLSSAGINLGQSNVGANLSQQNQEHAFQGANGNRSANENAILPANEKAANIAGSAVIHRGRGMVDLFA